MGIRGEFSRWRIIMLRDVRFSKHGSMFIGWSMFRFVDEPLKAIGSDCGVWQLK